MLTLGLRDYQDLTLNKLAANFFATPDKATWRQPGVMAHRGGPASSKGPVPLGTSIRPVSGWVSSTPHAHLGARGHCSTRTG
jgi:hypothetical protein